MNLTKPLLDKHNHIVIKDVYCTKILSKIIAEEPYKKPKQILSILRKKSENQENNRDDQNNENPKNNAVNEELHREEENDEREEKKEEEGKEDETHPKNRRPNFAVN